MTREEILQNHPLLTYVQDKGAKLKRSGRHFVTNICPITNHKPLHLCVSIEPERELWRCADCDQGGSVIDWIMHERGQTAAEVLASFGSNGHSQIQQPPTSEDEIEAIYDYTNENGKLIFQVVRYRPKTFRQRQPDEHGGWKWGLDGVERVLFNLPAVLVAPTVVVCEGEKDCESVGKLGFTATTNAGGSSGWLPAYASFLKGKDVIVIPDSDVPGAKHADAVVASLSDKANSIKRITLPEKDASDFISKFPTTEEAKKALDKIIEATPHVLKPLPLYSIPEMEIHYRKFVRNASTQSFDLSKFMHGFKRISPMPLFPGELVLILADTGVGKSLICQAMAQSASPLATLFFELELPLDMMFARFVQMEIGCYHHDVLRDYRENEDSFIENLRGLHHITVCPESGLTTDQIENYIERSELKIGCRPALVFVDYIGLVKHQGARSRYEAVSETAEAMKVIAKRTETIVVMASQVSRPAKDSKSEEVTLHSGKDSGALENSAGLVLGCWRPERELMKIKVLKNTKGVSGDVIDARFDGAKMRITEITQPYKNLR